MKRKIHPAMLFIATFMVMTAFAANSILNRLALADDLIDPYSFTSIRLLSGAVVLWLLSSLSKRKFNKTAFAFDKQVNAKANILFSQENFFKALLLFGYALFFSIAYIKLDAATGALILFASVQITILLFTHFLVRKLMPFEILGSSLALAGLAYMLLPGLNAPPLTSAVLILVSGICWGGFTLAGLYSKASSTSNDNQPLENIKTSFILASPLVLCALLISLLSELNYFTSSGIWLAIASGGLASGIGYWGWYQLLPWLSASQAASSQLSVPLLASVGGWIFLAEIPNQEILISGTVIILGIGLTLHKSNN